MTINKTSAVLACGFLMIATACVQLGPQGQAYWQRVEDNSALFMTGPKAQQQLEENIAGCVREVDELVELDALRKAPIADEHSNYRRALDTSGDLDHYNALTRLGSKKVAHSDFHDFDGCMRSKGWERVKYVRYQSAAQASETYAETKAYRETGMTGGGNVVAAPQQRRENSSDIYSGVNH